jgi:predicted ArsR family transcriptional regulator
MSGAMDVLRSLGSQPEMSEEGGKFVIRGNGCPISRVVEADVRSCAAMESFLSRLTGLPVKERCDHDKRPSCRFEISVPQEK